MWPFRRGKRPGQTAATGEPPQDRRAAFLEVLAGDRAPLEAYRRLVANRDAALDEVQDADDLPEGWELEDAILDHVVTAHRLVDVVDWVEDVARFVVAVDARLHGAGRGSIPQGDRDWIERWVAVHHRERGDAIGLAYGPLADLCETRGMRMVDLSTPGDCYRLTLMPTSTAETWIGVRLSAAFSVDDPSWQFESELAGRQFEGFLRPRIVRD